MQNMNEQKEKRKTKYVAFVAYKTFFKKKGDFTVLMYILVSFHMGYMYVVYTAE